jgi:hypothetical protein
VSRRRWGKKHGGYQLRSGFELKAAKHMDSLNVDYEYETLKLSYEIPASIHVYTPDFRLPNGIIVEAKGRFTPADRRKMALVIEQHPDKDIRLLFMIDNTLSKVSKTKYSDWCTKRGIKCVVSRAGEIPQEWFDEKQENKKKDD